MAIRSLSLIGCGDCGVGIRKKRIAQERTGYCTTSLVVDVGRELDHSLVDKPMVDSDCISDVGRDVAAE